MIWHLWPQRWIEGILFVLPLFSWGTWCKHNVTIGAGDNLLGLQIIKNNNNNTLSRREVTQSLFLQTIKVAIECKQTMACAHQHWQHVSIVITNDPYACIRKEFQVYVVNYFPCRVWSQLKSGLCHTIHYHSSYTFYNESTWN